MTCMSARNLIKAKEYSQDNLRKRQILFYRHLQEATVTWLRLKEKAGYSWRPWSYLEDGCLVRILWLRLLFFITVKGTLLFPVILQWAKQQNVNYGMGKQKGEEYESIVQLEKILEFLEFHRVSIQDVRHAIQLAETKAVPPAELSEFIARTILDSSTAEQALRHSLQTTRYWSWAHPKCVSSLQEGKIPPY